MFIVREILHKVVDIYEIKHFAQAKTTALLLSGIKLLNKHKDNHLAFTLRVVANTYDTRPESTPAECCGCSCKKCKHQDGNGKHTLECESRIWDEHYKTTTTPSPSH